MQLMSWIKKKKRLKQLKESQLCSPCLRWGGGRGDMPEDPSYITTQLEMVSGSLLFWKHLDPEAERGGVKAETFISCLPGSWGVLPRPEPQEVLGKWQPHLILGKLEPGTLRATFFPVALQKEKCEWDWQMVQGVNTPATKPEDPHSIPGTYRVELFPKVVL